MLAKRSEGLSPILQQKLLVDLDCPLKGEEGAAITASDCTPNADDAVHYVTNIVCDHPRLRILHCDLNWEGA